MVPQICAQELLHKQSTCCRFRTPFHPFVDLSVMLYSSTIISIGALRIRPIILLCRPKQPQPSLHGATSISLIWAPTHACLTLLAVWRDFMHWTTAEGQHVAVAPTDFASGTRKPCPCLWALSCRPPGKASWTAARGHPQA